jgi:TPR repeat protein
MVLHGGRGSRGGVETVTTMTSYLSRHNGHRLPTSYILCQTSLMRNLTATLCLTLAVLLGSAGVSVSQDIQKILDAFQRGDFATALREYTLAAEQGNATAQYNLGLMSYDGDGVPQDYVYAHMWGNISASNGNENGAKLRDLVAKEMTPSQIEKAQDLARECVAKNYKGC